MAINKEHLLKNKLIDENKKECCPKFNPKSWNGKILKWKNKKFIKDKVFAIFYMPVNFSSVIKKLMKKIDSANNKCVDWIGL
ncbi:MAG: hypothetical protein B6U87_02320 [Candidatus Aenigmarchaeota archaeon ex4484_52]|nr:MAG: hypothetical protein B6U87_02320 [Candidatus Aenigmarchaeota archaeon ex4484_52]